MLHRIVLAEQWLDRHWMLWSGVVAVIGLILRLYFAQLWYLNPDEAMHYMVAAYHPLSIADWYRAAGQVSHPPLYVWLLHGVLWFGDSQFVVRSLGVTAGAVFPLLMMRWVRGFAGIGAATCTLLILTFSPALIDLSAEVRAYTLAFIFVALCLNLLEPALDGSVPSTIWFHVFLSLAILTEFAVFWFVLGSSVYALAVLVSSRARPRMWVVWGIGQALVLGLYVFLYFTLIVHWKDSAGDGAVTGWLRPAFLQPGQNLVIFALKGTFRQFQYLLGSKPAAIAGAIAFPVGLFLLGKRGGWRVVLLTVPFAGAAVGAILHLFPYGATRHTSLLGLFAATGLAVALASIVRNKILPVLLAALVLIPVWPLTADPDPLAIPDERHLTTQMLGAVDFLCHDIPLGSIVVTDASTAYMLNYYLHVAGDLPSIASHYRVRRICGQQVIASREFAFTGNEQMRAVLSMVRRDLQWNGPIWVAAGGFGIRVTNPAIMNQPFQDAVAVFQATVETGRFTGDAGLMVVAPKAECCLERRSPRGTHAR
jgi:hypothetical protein